MADFIWANYKGFSITTDKVASDSDLNVIKKYIKNINVINSDNIMIPRLLQLKLYLKILSILYCIKDTNVLISFNAVERVFTVDSYL